MATNMEMTRAEGHTSTPQWLLDDSLFFVPSPKHTRNHGGSGLGAGAVPEWELGRFRTGNGHGSGLVVCGTADWGLAWFREAGPWWFKGEFARHTR